MRFFRFQRKSEPLAKEYSFDEIPAFSALTPAEQRLIEKKARLVEFKRGDIVYREGSPSEAFYVVLSGRFRVYTQAKGKDSETLFFLYRGDHFGETSILTNQPHSASVEAKRDGLVLKLDRDDFLKLVRDIPTISLYLNRSLGHRLTKSEETGGRSREVKIAGLYTLDDSESGLLFWFDFATRLLRETSRKVVVVDFMPRTTQGSAGKLQTIRPSFDFTNRDSSIPENTQRSIVECPEGFHYLHAPLNQNEEAGEKKVSSLITHLTYRYDYLLLRFDSRLEHSTFQIFKKTDQIYLFCSSATTQISKYAELVTELQQSFGFSKNDIRVLFYQNAPGGGSSNYDEKEKRLGLRVFALLPKAEEHAEQYHAVVRFLSRELAGLLIGLALGSGAAYGLAHIGVLKVLERENIPIDVIAGSSIGAFIGAFWAGGYDSGKLTEIAQSINRRNAFFKLIGVKDLSAVHRGFIKGNQMIRYMKEFLGDKTFQDLKIPVRIIAANLFTSEEVVLDSGRVVDAVRASISIPGIFRPFFYRGEYLIDGGVIDPLPVKVLSQMGVKKIIAVNVLSSPNDRIERARLAEKQRHLKLKKIAQANFFQRTVFGSMYQMNRRYEENIFNVIMNTIQFMEYEMAKTSGNDADVFIHPDIYEGHWAQFYEPNKFIAAGEKKTEEHLDEIRQLLRE